MRFEYTHAFCILLLLRGYCNEDYQSQGNVLLVPRRNDALVSLKDRDRVLNKPPKVGGRCVEKSISKHEISGPMPFRLQIG